MTPSTNGVSVSAGSSLADVVEQLTARLQAGEEIDSAAIVAAHPEHADRLSGLLPALRAVAALGGSADSSGDECHSNLELGDFRIIRQVGRGGMGVVYEAEQLSLRRRVALKVLPFAATMDPKQLQRFRNEALAAASLHHEHIVPVYAVGCERGVHYYAMQFIDGQTLAQVILASRERERPESGKINELASRERERPESGKINELASRERERPESGKINELASRERERPEPVTIAYTPVADGKTPVADAPGSPKPETGPIAALSTQWSGPRNRGFYRSAAETIAHAADALEYAHVVGIVHRDIKPGNLLIDAAGKVWVADFGLARFGPDAGLTMSGDLLGTLRYMAPEQTLARHGLADHRVDVYGLGCMLYELLTGRPAVGGTDKAEIVRRIAFEEPVAPRKMDRAIPAELETIALKCLAKNPNERYATAGELAADLRRFVEDRPIKAKPPTLLQRSARRLRRHPRVLAAAFAVAVLAAVGATVGAVLIDRQKQRAENAYADARAAFARARLGLEDLSSHVIDDWLAQQPSLSKEHRRFLERAAEHNDWLATRAGADEESRAGVAAAMARAGFIRYRLGQAAAAEAVYNGAIELYEGLAAEFPDQVGYRRELARAYKNRGLTRMGPARWADFNRAVALNEGMVGDFPSNAEYKNDLAESLGNLGRDYANHGHLRDARAICERAIAVISEPTSDRERFRVAHLYITSGFVGTLDGRFADGEQARRRAVELLDSLVRRNPHSSTYRFNLADALQQLAGCLDKEKLNRPAAALDAIRRAIEIARGLIAEFPSVPLYQYRLAECLSGLSHTLADLSRYSDAEAAGREAVGISEKLVANYPDVMEYKRYLAKLLSSLCVGYGRTGQYAQAEDASRRAIAVYEQMVAESASTFNQSDLFRLYANRGRNFFFWGRWPEAEASYRKSMELNPDDAQIYGLLGALLTKVGRYGEAEATLRRGIDINPNFAHLHNNLGVVYSAQEKHELAAASYRRAITILPNHATAHTNLGPVLRKLGRYDEALAATRRCHELFSKQPVWYYPSARWVRDAERLVALAPRLPALLSGEALPADADEQNAVARVYQDRKLNAAAVRFYAAAFAAAPPLADELDAYRFDAACAAALAGCGQGNDAAKLDDAERARCRQQALGWLTADLAGWTKLGENAAERPKVRDRVERWKNNARDLAGVRDAAPLAKLSEAECLAWQKLWADVDHLLTRVSGPPPDKQPPGREPVSD